MILIWNQTAGAELEAGPVVVRKRSRGWHWPLPWDAGKPLGVAEIGGRVRAAKVYRCRREVHEP